MKKPGFLPIAMLLGAMLSVQGGAALAIRLFEKVGPTAVVMLRLCLAAIVLVAVFRPKVTSLRGGRLLPVLGLGISLAAMNWLFYESISRIPLGTSVTIEFLGPIVLAIATSRHVADVAWVLLAATGVLLLSGTNGWTLGLGGIFAVAAGACWAAYILLTQRVGRLFADARGLALSMSVAGLAVIPSGLVTAGPRLTSMAVLGIGSLVALLSSVIPYTLEMRALRLVSARFYAVFYSLEPAVAAFVGAIFLNQPVNAREAFAICCVATASVGVSLELRRAPVVGPEHVQINGAGSLANLAGGSDDDQRLPR